MKTLVRYGLVAAATFTIFVRTGYAFELADKCEIEYKTCRYFCVVENLVDLDEFKKCDRKCKFNKFICKAKSTMQDILDKIKEARERIFNR